jgi:hypothetical protein
MEHKQLLMLVKAAAGHDSNKRGGQEKSKQKRQYKRKERSWFTMLSLLAAALSIGILFSTQLFLAGSAVVLTTANNIIVATAVQMQARVKVRVRVQ